MALRHPYLIHMQREGKLVNERNTECHGVNLVLDLNQKLSKSLVVLFSSFLHLSVFVLEPLLMYFLYCSVVQLVQVFHAYGRRGSSC